jgi:DNA-directed RNA polymerase beta' subunit
MALTEEIECVNFGIFSSEEIRKISVVEVNNPKLSGPNSVYDKHMGASADSEENCPTCELNYQACPGHFGHIELNEPIIHPKYLKMVLSYLKCFCIKCGVMMISKEKIELEGFQKYKRNIRFNKIIESMKKIDVCTSCKMLQPKVVLSIADASFRTIYKSGKKGDVNEVDIPLTTSEIYQIFEGVTDEQVELLGFNPRLIKPLNLIIGVLPVLPPCARPVVVSGEGSVSDDDLTNQYIEIIKANARLASQEENNEESKRIKNIQTLKFRIATLFDNSQKKAKHTQNGKVFKGIKERISGKEGQIRTNLMGKRCEQTARTVIGPEPTLRLGQVAVPREIAANLTVPEIVNRLNKEWLMDLLSQGKANYVIRKDKKTRINLSYALTTRGTELLYNDIIVNGGFKTHYVGQRNISLKMGDIILRNGQEIPVQFPKRKDFSIEEGDTVERQLMNGDIVLINRQPTLHRGSMMAKEVVVRDCKTFRFNLASTKSFNADFDGDEMNIHVPQTMEARIELRNLSATQHHLMTPQSSKPNIQIVQDSLLAIYRMTQSESVKMEKHHFFNIAMKGIQTNGESLSSKFILDKIQQIRRVLKLKGKKIQAFTGKGLFSLALPNNFNYENKNDADVNEPIVRIYKGVMYEGAINKSDVGGSSNSIIQLLYKEYGKELTATFIDNVQFLTNAWLTFSGFSVGIKDCLATKTNEINEVIEKCFMEAKGVEETTYHEGIKEARVNGALSKARDIGLRIAKNALDPKNNFLATVNSGSKGDFFNIAQITGLLGQQNLSGKRIQRHLNRGTRTLPHYPLKQEMSKEMEYESRGFIRHSFIHGLNPQEFYFHAMSGREGITDTAMGTSKSGYTQRKLTKVTENISVKYDGTVRNVEGHIYQFAYNEDGLDPSETIIKKGDGLFCDVGRLVDMLNMECEKKA